MTPHFGILGPLEAQRSDTLVQLGPRKQKAVLAALLTLPNQVVSLDRLIAMLWCEDVPPTAQASLQAYIYNLRKVLEPDRAVRSKAQVLVTQPPGYVLRVEPEDLDASKFESLAATGHRLLAKGHRNAARERLVEALALWRGPALAEFAFEEFAQPEAARLEQLRTVVREDLFEAELAMGNHAAIIGDLTVAVGEHPMQERLWGLLMLALYRSGRQADALRAFAVARHTLAEELGIDPSRALRSLEAAILAQSPELENYRSTAWIDEPSPGASRENSVGETARPIPFVGREDELRSLLSAVAQVKLGQERMVLLSGEAGIGKTRLAEELAKNVERDGWWVARGKAFERDGAPSYWLWKQMAEDLKRIDPDQVSKALAARRATLLPLMPDIDAVFGGSQDSLAPLPDTAAGRFALFEAMTGFLLDLVETGRLVMLLEDLQWADPFSLEMLEHVVARSQGGHVLIVATCRPPETFCAVPLTATISALARLPVFDWIELDGLSSEEVGRLLTQLGARANASLVNDIYDRTGGNPFFVAEFARLIRASGSPDCYPPGHLPSGARAVIRSRLSRLPEQTHRLLAIAAAIGEEFDIRTVAAASRAKLDDAVDWIHPAALVGLVSEDLVVPGTYRFCSNLVRDALHGEVAGLRRSAIHAFAKRLASASEDSPADRPVNRRNAAPEVSATRTSAAP